MQIEARWQKGNIQFIFDSVIPNYFTFFSTLKPVLFINMSCSWKFTHLPCSSLLHFSRNQQGWEEDPIEMEKLFLKLTKGAFCYFLKNCSPVSPFPSVDWEQLWGRRGLLFPTFLDTHSTSQFHGCSEMRWWQRHPFPLTLLHSLPGLGHLSPQSNMHKAAQLPPNLCARPSPPLFPVGLIP